MEVIYMEKSTSSSILKLITTRIPALFSKESISAITAKNEMSFEDANEALAVLAKDNNVDTQSKMQKLGYYGNVKLDAMLEACKDDERLIYEEFVKLDEKRDAILAKIVSKFDDQIGILLESIKETSGANASEIDTFIKTKVSFDNV